MFQDTEKCLVERASTVIYLSYLGEIACAYRLKEGLRTSVRVPVITKVYKDCRGTTNDE